MEKMCTEILKNVHEKQKKGGIKPGYLNFSFLSNLPSLV